MSKVIKILMNNTVLMLRNPFQLNAINTRLIIIMTKTGVQILYNAQSCFARILNGLNFARCCQMSSFPHGHRLIDQVVHSLGPIEFGSATHSHEIFPQLFSSTLLVGIYSQFIDLFEVYFWQLLIRSFFKSKISQYIGSFSIRQLSSIL